MKHFIQWLKDHWVQDYPCYMCSGRGFLFDDAYRQDCPLCYGRGTR